MRFRRYMTLLFAAFTLFHQASPAHGEDLLHQLKQRAAAKHLASNEHWQALLIYGYPWMGERKSLVDSREFFLAADGASHAAHELDATLEGLLQPAAKFAVDQHPQCLFPARFSWLVQQLDVARSAFPAVDCPRRDEFLAQRFAKMSLVFSAYFPNNPSSMFGHTFLRLHQTQEDNQKSRSDLLDKAVNFAATTADESALGYAVKGLFGRFPGKFSLMPYYMKIQEYNNIESRDLWEYPLNFTPDELNLLMQSLWELGPNAINYYYFDENCSYILMHWLAILRPELNLRQDLRTWVTPIDAVRVMQPIFTKDPPGFRASSKAKWLARMQHLSADNLELYQLAFASKKFPLQNPLWIKASAQEKALLLDAILDAIEFEEKIGGMLQVTNYRELYQEALHQRRHITIPAMPLKFSINPEDKTATTIVDPVSGHRTSWVNMGGGWLQSNTIKNSEAPWQGSIYSLTITPALHDFFAPTQGYGPGLEQGMAQLKVSYLPSSKRGLIESFDLFALNALTPWQYQARPLSWRFALGSKTFSECLASDRLCQTGYVGWQGGLTFATQKILLGLFAGVEGGVSEDRDLPLYTAPGFSIVAKGELFARTRLIMKAEHSRRFAGSRAQNIFSGQTGLAFDLNDRSSVNILYQYAVNEKHSRAKSSLELRWFF